ncbi:MAG: sulfatase-like hydrolase/transferase, partial [Acidobacteria bacterium]|nr:sulfatase-like hydrolase/transferase [Acidobacteriota bacterium]
DAGYQTGSVGKLHYHPPTAAHARSTGWDRVLLDDGVSFRDPYSDYVAWRKQNDPKADLPYQATAPGKNPFRGAIAYEYTPTAWTGAESRRLLREFAASGKPFLLHCSFFKPHAPHTVPEPYDAMYDDVEIPLPRRVTLDEIRKLPAPVERQILRGRPQYDLDRTRLQWIYRSYYAGVSMVDREVGLLLDDLPANTIVLLTTDHGDQLLEHGLEGKNLFFESSVRVPFLLWWPGPIGAAKRSELIEMVDVLPTLLDLCGLPPQPRIQGRSFASLVTGGSYRPREFAFAENIIPEVITSGGLDMPFVPGQGIAGIRHPDAKMIRTARWKLNYYPGNGGELYDIEADPGEERNLYQDAGSRTRVREMKDLLLDFLITADETDQIAPRWLLGR